MWEEFVEHVDYQSIQSYRQDVISGSFYDRILREYNCRLRDSKTRVWIKTEIFKVIYGRCRNTPVKIIFEELYPQLFKLFEIVKQGEHRRMAVLLQSIEAQLVINVVCSRIAKEKPSLPIFTIHDCIVTIEGNEDYVKTVMEQEMQCFIGAMSTIKVERWTSAEGTSH